MNQLDNGVAELPTIGDIVDQLCAQSVLVPKRTELEAYLTPNAELASHLNDICKKTRTAFGDRVELSLELYNDAEIEDRYLTLYVRLESYPQDFIDRIEAVTADFQHALETVSGYFLITTDFRRPRGADVV